MLDYAEICRKLLNVRICAENNKLCGNVRKTVNCAIPHPSHLIGASAKSNERYRTQSVLPVATIPLIDSVQNTAII